MFIFMNLGTLSSAINTATIMHAFNFLCYLFLFLVHLGLAGAYYIYLPANASYYSDFENPMSSYNTFETLSGSYFIWNIFEYCFMFVPVGYLILKVISKAKKGSKRGPWARFFNLLHDDKIFGIIFVM